MSATIPFWIAATLAKGSQIFSWLWWEVAVPVSVLLIPPFTTIDFWFSAERDAVAAKRFFQKALQAPGHPRPRVITVDGNPS